MLRKIVAGIDGRPGGADAAALAAALAGPEADVLLVGVYRDPLMRGSGRGRRRTARSPGAAWRGLSRCARGATEDPGAPRRIAVGFDGSPESRAALAAARALSGEDASRMTVVAVVDDQMPSSMAWFGAPPEKRIGGRR